MQMYLSAATLIVVPATLIDQWIQEFHKYTLDNYLSILVIQSNQEFPPPEELSKYDVVLTSHTRISKERCTLNGYNSFSERCYCDFGVRSATCKSCQSARLRSPSALPLFDAHLSLSLSPLPHSLTHQLTGL